MPPPSPGLYSKTMKSIEKYKEQDPMTTTNSFMDRQVGDKAGHKKRPSVEFNPGRSKDTPVKGKKEEVTLNQSNFYTSYYNSKRNFFTNK